MVQSRTLSSALSTACNCNSALRTQARHQSTSAASSSQRIVAAALLSRPPLLLPALTPLEESYYTYQRRLHRALAKPLSASTEWFFKKGSASEKSFVAFDQKVDKERGDEGELSAYVKAGEEVEGAPEVVGRESEADRKGDVTSLERKMDRTLYLLLKKDRKDNAWQFPQGGVEADESLLEAAQRELVEETGPDMDVWATGRAPAGAYEYKFPKEFVKKNPGHDGARVFFLPMRVIRGQAKPNKKEGLVGHAWLTKEEVKEKVSADYWKAVEPMLSDL
ncbi:hypothetical protein BCR35DRAFT_300632 [Leucosporidium creatinivorum]|uniref:Large ribosomal subunit protein mL46 n=1 Tax=Leucosporidium creatinivorum TaxID=106004 RepID=A0A1Y2FZB0_9BASI|nr:hypothetical protein BCR35DRAFT_300632 [Leucosporidium creatinivorum]